VIHRLLLISALGVACNKDAADTGDMAAAAGDPDISVTPDFIDYGLGVAGNQVPAQITITNQGTGLLETTISTTAPFSVDVTARNLEPGAELTINVIWYPTTYEVFSGEVCVDSNDPDTPQICIGLSGEVVGDADGDGHFRPDAGGEDCDDDDPNTYPGAPETWYDDVDQDCAEDDDFDQDGDGYQSAIHNPDEALGGGDCNDVWPDIHPGAKDEWYDGVDSDCGGEDDWDADGDGWGNAYYDRGDDCDDNNADVYPGAPERLNGELDDCDGDADRAIPASGADIHYVGDDTLQFGGSAVAAGDIDGDGIDDMVVGVPGYNLDLGGVAVYLSTFGLPAAGAGMVIGSTDFFDNEKDAEQFGAELVMLRDYDGDELPDLVVGAPEAGGDSLGRISVIPSSELAVGANQSSVIFQINPTPGHHYVGRSMAGPVDLDGDGLDEIIFEYRPSTLAGDNSQIAISYGGELGDNLVAQVDARYLADGDPYGSEVPGYQTLSSGWDLDGDGYEDWIYCHPLEDIALQNDGAVWALFGKGSRYSTSSLALIGSDGVVVARGARTLDWGGYTCALMPDADGDGDAEMIYYVREEGAYYLIPGGTERREGTVNQYEAIGGLAISADWDPSEIAPIGDWTGDGIQEWGFAYDGSSVPLPGAYYLYDPTTFLDGVVSYDQSPLATFEPDDDEGSALFGWAVPKLPGDYDGDGRHDLAIGDPGWEGDLDGDKLEEIAAGAVYLFFGTDL